MRFAIVVFPGSIETDCYKAVEAIGESAELVRHTVEDLSAYDCIILPGGASYGNYLRAGAIARLAPIAEALVKAANAGKYVLGISNGFQILTEIGLLPGALLRNSTLKFICQSTTLRVDNAETPFTKEYQAGESITLPIAHGEGNYYCDEATLAELKANHQIVFRYAGNNPNGSIDDIAGICNKAGNVLGMMPHPERAMSAWLGSEDGKRMFTSILSTWREQNGAAAR